MNVFKEGSSLSLMNHELAILIPKYQLLGDLPLSINDFYYLATKLKELFFGNKFQLYMKSKYEECFAVFVVFCAVYEYDQRKFWGPVEKYLGELGPYSRTELYDIFSNVLEKFHLNKFENESEEGFRYVTPILCHAGIPINALDSYFVAVSNTVNDLFYDDFDVDDYLAYFKNKTEVTVRRYLKLAEKKIAYNFIQNTRKAILYDSVDQDEELDSGNFTRMIEQISIWKEQPRVKKSLQARKNVQITAPKIKIDIEGMGVYCELPRIVVKDSYDSYLVWEVVMDESSNLIKADLFSRNGVFVSEEKIFTLKPAKTYIITLKIDDEMISKWEIEGVVNSYFAFEQNGYLIKKSIFPNRSILLLLKKGLVILDKGNVPTIELPQIPLWSQYNVYHLELSHISVLPFSHIAIPVSSEKKPVLVGGKKLFDQENTCAFSELPKIKVPILNGGDWHLEIKHRFENMILNRFNATIESCHPEISLGKYIQTGSFGQYEIKIWNRSGLNEKFLIEYVPVCKILMNPNEYWPSNVYGYLNQVHTIRTSKKAELDFFNADKMGEIHKDDYLYYKFKLTEKNRFLIGEYKYRYFENLYKTPVKVNIFPIAWGINENENGTIEFASKMYIFTLRDFANSTDPYLLFSFGFHSSFDIQTIKIELIDIDQQIVTQNERSIVNKEGLRISLNPFLFEIQNRTESHVDYNLRVSLLNSNERIVTSFIVARFQDEMVIRNCHLTQLENEVVINWKEEGSKSGREIVMVNFIKPWKKPYHFDVVDKTTEFRMKIDHLDSGIYKYFIQKKSENLFFDEIEAEICTLNQPKKGRIRVRGGDNDSSSPMERVLCEIMKVRFLKPEFVDKRLLKIRNEIKNLSVQLPEDLKMLSYAYILYHRFPSKRLKASDVSNIFDSLFDLFANDKTETLRFILDSTFSIEYKKQLLKKFYCTILTYKPKLNDIQLKMLAKVDENVYGFIHLIQSENKVVGLNWAGISDICILKEEGLFGEEYHSFLSEENLGKILYIEQYFQYLYQSIQHPRNFSKSTADFLREFQNQQDVRETKIFGKTRLQLLVEWREQTKEITHVQEQLAEALNICNDSHLKKHFMDVFQALSKRKEADEIGYYIGLIALYASFIRNGLMSETKEFRNLLCYTIEKCNKLYYRDAIIIELYMQRERGYTWG